MTTHPFDSMLERVDQAILAERPDGHDANGTPGDCFRACLAMMTGASLHETPHAVMYLSWFDVARRFVRATSGDAIDLLHYEWDGSTDLYGDDIPRPVIAVGRSPRGTFHHCVIADSTNGEVWHDPHPSRAGLAAIEGVDAKVPMSPDNPPLSPVLALTSGGSA